MEFSVPDEKRKLYLSAIIDLYDRYPVAHVNCNLVNNGGFIIGNVYFNIGLDTKQFSLLKEIFNTNALTITCNDDRI